MTRSAGDAVIPHSRPGIWRSASSSVWTRVHTGRPVRTACTGCAEVCAASGGLQMTFVLVYIFAMKIYFDSGWVKFLGQGQSSGSWEENKSSVLKVSNC